MGHRRPQRRHPAPVRDPVRRARLLGSRDTARARPENVRVASSHCLPRDPERDTGASSANKNLSKNLTLALSTLSNDTDVPPGQQADTTTDPSNPPLSSIQLPPEIIDYVDSARNPDIYTREFVELVQRGNQDLKGKREAFAGFRDVLAREMRSAMPECRAEVDRVVAASASASASADDQRDGAGPSQ